MNVNIMGKIAKPPLFMVHNDCPCSGIRDMNSTDALMNQGFGKLISNIVKRKKNLQIN